jgi:hypothetical protein
MLNKKGNLLFDVWCHKLEQFPQVLKVFNGNKSALFNYEGELMGKWWDAITLYDDNNNVSGGLNDIHGGVAQDMQQNKKYIIGVNGNVLAETPENYFVCDMLYIKNADRYIIYFHSYTSYNTYLNVLNSDGTFVFDEALVAALDRPYTLDKPYRDNVIECYTQRGRKEYDINKITGEIIEVEG